MPRIVLTSNFFLACYGGIQAGSDSDSFILGDAFLNSQFVVFDAGSEPRLGFAAKPVQKNWPIENWDEKQRALETGRSMIYPVSG